MISSRPLFLWKNGGYGTILPMLKELLLKKMFQSQLAKLPEEEREKARKLTEEHPEFLMKIAKELEDAVKSGKSQTEAAIEIAQKYQEEIKKLL